MTISLSLNDYIGHAFGPYSLQVADTTLRTDRYLASVFAELDKLVGLKNVWIALATDHGVAPNPEFIQGHKWCPGNAQPALGPQRGRKSNGLGFWARALGCGSG